MLFLSSNSLIILLQPINSDIKKMPENINKNNLLIYEMLSMNITVNQTNKLPPKIANLRSLNDF